MTSIKSDLYTWRGVLGEMGGDADSRPTAWAAGVSADTRVYVWRDGRVTLVSTPCDALVSLDEAVPFSDDTWAALVAEEVTGGRVFFDSWGAAWATCAAEHRDASEFGPWGVARPLTSYEVEALSRGAAGRSAYDAIKDAVPVTRTDDGWVTVGRDLPARRRDVQRRQEGMKGWTTIESRTVSQSPWEATQYRWDPACRRGPWSPVVSISRTGDDGDREVVATAMLEGWALRIDSQFEGCPRPPEDVLGRLAAELMRRGPA